MKMVKEYFSHLGSTFGGIIIRSGFNDIRHVNAITNKLEIYLREQNFDKVYLKIHQEYFVKRILHY